MMNQDIKILLGKRIKELRTKKHLTQEQLAEQIGVGVRNVSKIECGKNFVTSETLSKILTILDVEASDLFNFSSHSDNKILKAELIDAIKNETVDIKLLYKFYKSIK